VINKIYSLSMRKKYSQLDKQLFFDFYGVSLLSDQYLESNSYASQYKDMIVQQVKEEYVPLITKMVYHEFKHIGQLFDCDKWKKLFGITKVEDFTLEQLQQIYNEGDWETAYGGPPWGHITESLIQLINTTDTNQLITIIDHINDIQHNTGLMFHDFPKVEKWFSDALNIKAQATPEQLIPYLSSDIQKFVTEDLKLRGQEVVAPEEYLTISEKIKLAESSNTSLEVFRKLVKEEDIDILMAIAENQNAPPSVLVDLAKNPNSEIRWEVATNERTFPVTLEELAKDIDRDVRSEAIYALKMLKKYKGYGGTSNLNMRKKSYIMYNDKGQKFEVNL